MNKIPIARSVATYFATLAVASALTGVFAAPAQADPAPTSTVEPPSSSTAPEPGAPSPTATATSQPAVPKPQAAPAQRAQVEVSLEFDKDAYQTNEDVHFTFKLKNIGESRAVGLQVAQFMGDPTDLTLVDWGPLRAKPGVTLEPGKTFELAVSGTIGDLEKDSTVVRGFVYDESGASAAPPFSFSAKVTRVTGHAVGTVFGDRNGNGKFDGGEQLGGIPLTLRYSSKTYTATSDADGKFDFGDIPAAKYVIGGDVIKGWLFPYDTIQIGPDTKDLLVRGAPPLNGALHASMAFTKDSYKVGDVAQVTVKLSNSGPIPLTGIVAACNRVGNAYILNGTGPGWGDLVRSRGVTIEPGQTRTFDVSEAVPKAALNRGFVAVACDFGYDEVDIDNHANAEDRAAVPGAFGTVVGDVVYHPGQGKPQQAVAGVKVVLVNEQHCPVVGEQTTDANGHFEFHHVLPGPDYHLYLLPPKGWKIKFENPTSIDVSGPEGNPSRVGIEAEPGDAPLPTVPTQPADCGASGTPTTTAPAQGGGSGGQGSSGLALTGADVITFGAVGLVALAIGAGLVLAARRRRRVTG